MQQLVTQLHRFATDVRLTHAEWRGALAFMHRKVVAALGLVLLTLLKLLLLLQLLLSLQLLKLLLPLQLLLQLLLLKLLLLKLKNTELKLLKPLKLLQLLLLNQKKLKNNLFFKISKKPSWQLSAWLFCY